ncbi:MAG TPA: hypothetical protein VF950_19765 [Planctomycetota bacterium]
MKRLLALLVLGGCAAPPEEADLPRTLGDDILQTEAIVDDMILLRFPWSDEDILLLPSVEFLFVPPGEVSPSVFLREPDRGLYANTIPAPR